MRYRKGIGSMRDVNLTLNRRGFEEIENIPYITGVKEFRVFDKDRRTAFIEFLEGGFKFDSRRKEDRVSFYGGNIIWFDLVF